MHTHLTQPFREQLLAQRASLIEQLALQRGGLVDRAQADGRAPQPEDSHAQSATERELAFALDERETAEVAAIDAALQRIAAGHYGECLACTREVLLTGPGLARTNFRDWCNSHQKAIAGVIVDSIAADHPTDAQLVALARQYFKKFDNLAADPSVA